jgi:signal transduction histidine kinase
MYIWPNSASWDQVSQSILLSFAGTLALIFTMKFLHTIRSAPLADRIMRIFAYIYLFMALALITSIFLPIPTAPIYFGIFFLSLISPCLALYVSVKNVLNGAQSASYFIMGWGVFCIGVITASLRLLNMAPNNIFTMYALQISSAIEMLLFSFALAHRFQSEQNEKVIIQEQLLKAKEGTLTALRLSEERLELAVNDRTAKLQQLLASEQHMREQYVRFGAMIAHEFRNPLNIIQAQITMLEHDAKLSHAKILNRTSVIQTAVARLTRLFDEWLESDRLSNAGNQINAQPILVNCWLNVSLKSYKPYYADHELILTSIPEPLSILGDDHLIQLAVLNLIDNACKYSPSNSKIHIGISRDDYGVGIYVQDEGCGIPIEMQEKILEPYVRINNDVKAKGDGLGLAFVKRIMEAHDGRIQIQSNPSHGATITLWFPELVT